MLILHISVVVFIQARYVYIVVKLTKLQTQFLITHRSSSLAQTVFSGDVFKYNGVKRFCFKQFIITTHVENT